MVTMTTTATMKAATNAAATMMAMAGTMAPTAAPVMAQTTAPTTTKTKRDQRSTKSKSNTKRPTKKQIDAAHAAHVATLETALLVPKVIKKKSFTEVEDVFLCRAYVNATQDSEMGSGQKCEIEIYWKTVHSNYDTLHFQEDSTVCIDDWGVDSLKNRYSKIIQKECLKFVKFLAASKSTYQSGWGDMDYINATDLLWIEQHNKSFKHKKCMEVLCVLPKYSMDPPATGSEIGEEDALSNPMIPVQESTRERPMGRTKVKKQLKSEIDGSKKKKT